MGSYTGEISFNSKMITVWGQGKVLDALGGGRFFTGSAGSWYEISSLKLHQVVLQNGYVNGVASGLREGGAIYAEGGHIVVEIHDSTFKNNTATIGGAIYTGYIVVEIRDSTFESNIVSLRSDGGAIYFNGGTVEIHDTTFESNTAQNTCCGGSKVGQVCSSDSDCPGNYCGCGAGGAIYANWANVKIYTSIFESNSAIEGGAMYSKGSTLGIYDSAFESNTAPNGNGGAIFAGGWADMEVHDSTFQNNTANTEGGAISANYAANVEIYDSAFQSNTAGYTGGAIRVTRGAMQIHTSSFISNQGQYGGAIKAATDANVEIHDSTFQANTATRDYGGGAISAGGAQILLVQITAMLNTLPHYTGSTFTHRCYDGFYFEVDTAKCAQCLAGKFKSFASNPGALACTECPEVLYLYSLYVVYVLYLYSQCAVSKRAGTGISLAPRPAARTA
jgi:predicted outer membrane repeat protein